MFEIFTAFAASIAFALKFGVSKNELLCCGFAGVVSEGVFLTASSTIGGEAFSVLVAAAAVTAFSRLLANVRLSPVTAYLMTGILPLVPGAGMYYTVFNIISSNYAAAATYGFYTIKSAGAAATGISIVFALPNKMFFKRKQK